MTLDQIRQRILDTYSSAHVEVGDMTGTGDHIQVLVVSDHFSGQNRIQRQRMVHNIFQEELKSGEIHALTIRAITTQEK